MIGLRDFGFGVNWLTRQDFFKTMLSPLAAPYSSNLKFIPISNTITGKIHLKLLPQENILHATGSLHRREQGAIIWLWG